MDGRRGNVYRWRPFDHCFVGIGLTKEHLRVVGIGLTNDLHLFVGPGLSNELHFLLKEARDKGPGTRGQGPWTGGLEARAQIPDPWAQN